MEAKAVAEMVKKLNDAGAEFLKQYEDELNAFIDMKEPTAEESLQKEILLELLDHIYGIRHIAERLEKKVCKTGTLDQDEDGEILLDGKVLPFMTELEVFVYDEDLKRDIWTRTFIGGFEKRCLVGIKNNEINGITARIRE